MGYGVTAGVVEVRVLVVGLLAWSVACIQTCACRVHVAVCIHVHAVQIA